MKRLVLGISIMALLVVGMVSQSQAASFTPLTVGTVGNCVGLEGIGTCNKIVSLQGTTLKIQLENTSTFANGGFITADGFDLTPGAVVNSFSFDSTSATAFFGLVSPTAATPPDISVAPFGARQFVISNQPGATQPWLGSGNPNNGLATGEKVLFTLELGGDLTGVTEDSVFSTEVIRFRGFDEEPGSDKATTEITGVIPEPSTVLLFGTGLAGLGIWRWRKGQKS